MAKIRRRAKLKWLFFDLDDTLISSSTYYENALSAVGIDPESHEFCAAKNQVKDQLGRGHVSSHHRLLYIKRYFESKNQPFSPNELLAVYERYLQALESLIIKDPMLPATRDILTSLAEVCHLGIITNETLYTQLRKLRAMDPGGKLFSLLVTAEEAGVEKPCPAIFHLALAKAHARPEETLHIGDSLDDDVRGAMAVGMQPVWYQNALTGRAVTWGPDDSCFAITSLQQLLPYVTGATDSLAI